MTSQYNRVQCNTIHYMAVVRKNNNTNKAIQIKLGTILTNAMVWAPIILLPKCHRLVANRKFVKKM